MDRPDLPVVIARPCPARAGPLNWWSGSERILWASIRRLAVANHADRPLRVLDVACGAGDVLVGLAGRAKQAGIALELRGIDVSPTAIDHARTTVRCRRIPGLVGVSTMPSPNRCPAGFDVVTCSLFLHHLTDDQAADVLRRCAAATNRLVLINDLRRSWAGWLLAVAACRLLTRSPVVHSDGPRSVERAFTPSEALDDTHRAGLANAVISRRWPFRFLLTWDRANT